MLTLFYHKFLILARLEAEFKTFLIFSDIFDKL